MRPGPRWRTIPAFNILQSPIDLGLIIRAPINTHSCHLITRQTLRNTIRATTLILSLVIPSGLLIPQLH